MQLVYVDPEARSATGGGIRTYLKLAAALCQRHGMAVRIYSHNPEAYSACEARPIGRRAWLPRGLRALAYRFCYGETVAWEHARWLLEELRNTNPDCVEFADFQGYGYYAVRDLKMRKRVTLRVHTPLYLVYRQSRGLQAWACIWLCGRERSTLMLAENVTAPSAEFIREKLPWLQQYRTLPNPPPLVSPAAEAGVSPAGEFRIVFLGRLEPRKGALELLKAFLILAEENSSLTLTLIGDAADADYAASLHRMADNASATLRNKIQWLPAQSGEKSALLQSFSCLVVPSLWENSPYVFWEGMAAGIPCLGTETGEMQRARRSTGAPEITPGKPEALAAALRQLIVSPDFCRALTARQFDYLRRVALETEALPSYYQACAQANSRLD